MSNKKSKSLVQLYMTLMVAFFCAIKTINVYLTRGVDTEGENRGPMAMMYMASIIGIAGLSLFIRRERTYKIPISALFILIWIIASYLYTMLFIGEPFTSFVFFGVFTIASFLIPLFAVIDGRLFLKAIMLFAVPAIFNLNKVFAPAQWYQDYISMGVSYSFLAPIVATIVYMFCYYRQENKWQKKLGVIGVLANLVFAFYLFSDGSRGPFFSIVSLLFFLMFFKSNPNKLGVYYKKGTIFWVGVILISVGILFVPILSLFHNILSSFGVSFNVIDKFIELNNESNITNGREIIYLTTISGILEKPLFGWGIDLYYLHNEAFTYPHNFIMQILYDGGIVLFFVLMVPLYKGIKRIWKTCTLDEYAVYTALFFGSVPGALFTDDLWNNCFLWLFFGALLSKSFVKVNRFLLIQDKKNTDIIKLQNNENSIYSSK